MNRSSVLLAVLSIGFLAFTGCGDDGGSGGSGGSGGDVDAASPTPDAAGGEADAAAAADAADLNPTFDVDIQPILTANCTASGCHAGAAPAGVPPLSLEDNAYANIVSVASSVDGVNLVEPGDPAMSYLMAKLEGTQADLGGGGLSMPIGVSLPDDQLTLIREWIADGAPQ